MFDAATDNVLMHGQPRAIAKQELQARRAKTRNGRKMGDMQLLIEVLADEIGQHL